MQKRGLVITCSAFLFVGTVVFLAWSDSSLQAEQRKSRTAQDDKNVIYLRGRAIDTAVPTPAVPKQLRMSPTVGDQLHLIHFAGPIKEEWLEEVKAQGKVKVITYISNNAYLIWTDGPTLEKLQELSSRRPFLKWTGPYHPAYKLHPEVSRTIEAGGEDVKVTVQFFAHEGVEESIAAVKAKAKEVIRDVWSVGAYRNLRILIAPAQLVGVSSLPDIVNIEPWSEPVLFGERQGQILANQLNAAGSQPTAPGYLAWLNGLGFNPGPCTQFSFVVDVTDSGFDRGQTTVANLHQDFLDACGNSRGAYVQRVSGTTIDTTAANNNDTGGHGTINLAIVGGFNNTADSPSGGTDFEDAAGYQYGLGVAPFVRLGSSRIFAPGFTFPDYTELINAAFSKGARISNNSWGSRFGTGVYDSTSQEYDALVRDARPATASDGGQSGNQEITIVFAAGNRGRSGSSTLGDRGSTAKNTLVVGASENWNQAGTDGCGTSNAGANDARDIIKFSSQGPTQDNRVKPDIVAPGTHIFGTASQDPGFNGDGVCAAAANVPGDGDGEGASFFPTTQTLYTWSSGTSHSTPAVAGGAALVRQWFLNQGKPAPSPAMTKAYLMNSATYITGANANDTLPSNSQGVGRMNLQRAFDAVPRHLVDQTVTLNDSGDIFTIDGTIVDDAQPFRVTLAWTDAPGPTVSNAWVNDLDLEVTVDGTLYRGNVFNKDQSQSGGAADRRNNVESVWLAASGGTSTNCSTIRQRGKDATITIRASNIAGDGIPNQGDSFDQDFALVAYNFAPSTASGNGNQGLAYPAHLGLLLLPAVLGGWLALTGLRKRKVALA